MLGWEFPPFISGGLGTACYGLTKAISQLGTEVVFVLPKMIDHQDSTHVKLLSPSSLSHSFTYHQVEEIKNVKIKTIDSPLQPYLTPQQYSKKIEEIIHKKRFFTGEVSYNDVNKDNAHYSGDMFTEVRRYAVVAAELATKEDFDIIHAHDWMTYPAAMAVASITGKPLVVHIHSTEFDRSGEHVNQPIYDIERKGFHAAEKVIAVSYFTRNTVTSRYSIDGDKVEVVHNGIDRSLNSDSNVNWALKHTGIEKEEKIVLFLGRITMQKGPEYFLRAAKKVLDVYDNVKFVMAGSGDLMHQSVEMAVNLGIGSKVLFTGFLRGDDVQRIYKMADLFVMPSVSEPFGIVPLEALNNDVPVIISKQSGVSEVLTHVLKVDFWDVDEIANKVVAVLKYPSLKISLQNHGNFEASKLTWKNSATKCVEIYKQLLCGAYC
ncbi:MAG: glycosyltransferase family 4 protein [Phycisphaerae bacterium]|nr:glycosyltransferase family 4 protein [Phycisphaerae bacterium]